MRAKPFPGSPSLIPFLTTQIPNRPTRTSYDISLGEYLRGFLDTPCLRHNKNISWGLFNYIMKMNRICHERLFTELCSHEVASYGPRLQCIGFKRKC